MGLFGGIFGKKKKELPPLDIPRYEDTEELPPLPEVSALPAEEPMAEKAVKSEEEELGSIFEEEPEPMAESAVPERKYLDVDEIFVKSDDFRNIMQSIKDIRVKVNDSDKIFVNIKELKSQSDKEFAKMKNQVEDIQRKLVYVDKTAFGGQ